jgi:hypothetical protein
MARWADGGILIMPGFKPITNHLSKTHIKVGDALRHHKRLSQSECYSDTSGKKIWFKL